MLGGMNEVVLSSLEQEWLQLTLPPDELSKLQALPAKIIRELNPDVFGFGPEHEAVISILDSIIGMANTGSQAPFNSDCSSKLRSYAQRVKTVYTLPKYKRILYGLEPQEMSCSHRAVLHIEDYIQQKTLGRYKDVDVMCLLGVGLAVVGPHFHASSFSENLNTERVDYEQLIHSVVQQNSISEQRA